MPANRRDRDKEELQLLSRLTGRDVQVLLDVHELEVLTTNQLARAHFPTARIAQRRLERLSEDFEILHRFRPSRSARAGGGSAPHPALATEPGSSPFHYVLSDRGARIVGALLRSKVEYSPASALRLADPRRHASLRHPLAVGDFWAALAGVVREPGSRLSWMGERRVAERWVTRVGATFGPSVRPDGVGDLKRGRARVRFYLELDRGTETLATLGRKVAGYLFPPDDVDVVLFCFETPGREPRAREVLHHHEVPVATTTCERHSSDPLGAIWRLVGIEEPVTLLELAGAWERRREREASA
ncbi:MAG: replication-relaxation family protein [Candidatus Methylomirabilales bacterium]